MTQTVKKSARMRRLDTLGNKINKLTKINLRQNPRSAQYKRNSKLIANLTNVLKHIQLPRGFVALRYEAP